MSLRLTQDKSVMADKKMANLCVSLLRKLQKDTCALCKANIAVTGFQIDHKWYGEDITLYDLQLLCGPCHAKKTGIKKHTGTLRKLT